MCGFSADIARTESGRIPDVRRTFSERFWKEFGTFQALSALVACLCRTDAKRFFPTSSPNFDAPKASILAPSPCYIFALPLASSRSALGWIPFLTCSFLIFRWRWSPTTWQVRQPWQEAKLSRSLLHQREFTRHALRHGKSGQSAENRFDIHVLAKFLRK